MDRTAAFLKLFLAHEGDLRAYIGSVLRDTALREDVFQDVALALWKSFDRFDSARSFGAWARGVATNKILQQRRQDGRIPLAFSPEAIQAVQDAFDRTERPPGEREAALKLCLERLPEKSSQLLDLRYAHKASATAIAARVGMSVDAVYQSLSRLRVQLADCVRRRMQGATTQRITSQIRPNP